MGSAAYRAHRERNLEAQERHYSEVREQASSPVFGSKSFTWDNSGLVTVATAEMSELGRGLANYPLGALIRIRSARTGEFLWLTLDNIARDEVENELRYVEFKGTTKDGGRQVTAMIFND